MGLWCVYWPADEGEGKEPCCDSLLSFFFFFNHLLYLLAHCSVRERKKKKELKEAAHQSFRRLIYGQDGELISTS